MEDFVANQEQLVGAMEQLLSSFKKMGRDRRTSDYILRKLDTLDSYWKEFEANHSRFSKIYEHEDINYHRENHYDKALDFYNNAKAYLQQCLPRVTTPIGVTGDTKFLQPSPSTAGPARENQETKSQGTDSKTAELLKKQATNFKAFLRTIQDFDLEAVTEKWEFEDLLQQLQSRWSVIDSLHWQIDNELNSTDVEYEMAFTANEKRYKTMKKAINSKLWSASHRDHFTPKIEIPVFSGNYYHWVSFKDLFTEAIHSNPSLNNAQKMQFLKSKVRGEAEKLIQHLGINSDNYHVCWELLNHRFNNKRLIFTSHVNILLNIPVMQQPNVTHIKRIHDTINECLNSIKNLGVDVSSWDPLLVQLMSLKLDQDTYNDYLESLKQPRELPSLKDFLEFLEMKFTTMESAATRKKQENMNKSSNLTPIRAQRPVKPYNIKSFATNQVASKSFIQENKKASSRNLNITCVICNEEHGIFYCQQFLSMSPDDKRKTISKYNLCKNCLFDHQGKNCLSSKTCRACNAQHNTILHDAFSNHRKHKPSSPETPHGNSYVSQKSASSEILITTAIVNVRDRGGNYHKMRALIDQCSQMTLITESAAQILRLPRSRSKGIISGVGQKESTCKGIITLTCSSIYNKYFEFTTEAYIMTKIVKNLPSCTINKQNWPHLQGLQLADSDFNVSRPIDMILGSDVFPSIILDGLRKGSSISMPVAQQTELGWIVCGSILTSQSRQCYVIVNSMDNLQRFWQIEDIAEDTELSVEDKQCVTFFENTTVRKQDGRYEVRLPLKQDYEKQLGSSKSIAIAQFHQLERRFKRNKNTEKEYKLFLNEYIALGHMKRSLYNMQPDYYLPHHCVLRADSTTTKLRVVFNASSKTLSGSSLNDIMYRGPNLQKDLQSLILKWRQYKYAFTADIEKMFRQIWIAEEDQKLQKCIWRDTQTGALTEYQLTTVTYGTKAAPFLAMMTLQQLAKDEQGQYPESEAIRALKESFYMDDVLHGAHCIPSAKLVQRDLSRILKSGGFNLRKWSSNSSELLNDISPGQPEQKGYDFRQAESTKTLGLRWNCKQDNFLFESKIKPNTLTPTKRSMLSDISKLFDPLGWLSPLTTKLKIMFQLVWQTSLQWDDKLPENIKQQWVKSMEDIDQIKHYHIPRWLGIQKNKDFELHGFCDASTKAYACVIYCRITSQENSKVYLVAGKARLVPTSKNISLPKLELMGAHLLSRLMTKIKTCYNNYNIKIYGWVDSMVVLGWLNGDPGKWKPFVENRVKQIKEVIPAESWRYVKSQENPADCSSRGMSATQLKNHDLWWHGPSWLQDMNTSPDSELPKYFTDQEVKKVPKQVNVITKQDKDSDIIATLITRFSSFSFIVRVVAWLRRIITKQQVGKINYLTLLEIKQATIIVMKNHQQTEFYHEISSLRAGKNISNKSKIISLYPFLDKHGLLRVGGRLRHARINEERKTPIIISNGRLAELLIDHAHKMTYHGGARLCLAFIRQKYWIISGMRTVKKQLRNCVTCRKQNPQKLQQLMGDLPQARCNPCPRAFYHTGVDFTGYVTIKANKGRGVKTTKGYIAVFVCMATKAVHLELVSDLTTSAFIAALRRMSARRGTPCHMYSDNGTNFLGANNILQHEFEQLQINHPEIMTVAAELEIQWHFNAPSWPSAGGLWEAAVKSLKYHLKRVIGEQNLTYEEFSTLLAQLEATLNSRPICPLSEDPDDLDYLTPAHFLTGGSALTVLETERDLRTRWHLTQKIFQDIWKRWRSEYLDQITARSKWQKQQENIKINDVVLIHDDNLPAGKWLLGRVTELHPGADGYVRVVTLKVKNGFIKRPIIKLSILPTQSENQVPVNISNTQTQQNIKSKRGSHFSSVVMALLFFMTIISSAASSYNITEIKDRYIYFDKISDMRLIRDEWRILTYYDMDPYQQGLTALDKYIQYLNNECDKINKAMRCEILLLQLQHGYSELEHYNHMLLSQQSGTRQRRGLIDGVGYVANSLFGVLDQRFAEQYQKDIQLIRDNQKHMVSLWKNQTSIIESQNNVLKRMTILIDKQHKAINQHLMTLDAKTDGIKQEIQENYDMNVFTFTALIANNMLLNLKNIQEVLLDTVTDIYHGRFNPHLLAPEQLKSELSNIASQLPKDFVLPVDFVQSDLKNMYQLLTVKTRLSKKYCLFEIKVPLVSQDFFEIYNLIPIPLQSSSNKISIVPKSEYVGINLQKDIYMIITETDLKQCLEFSVTSLCRIQNPVNHLISDNDLCEVNQQTNQCKTTLKSCSNEWIKMNNVNSFVYFCCHECQVRILCKDQVTVKQLVHSGIINLGQGCMMKTNNFTIYSHKDMSSKVKISSPVTNLVYISPINNLFNFSVPVQSQVSNASEVSETQLQIQEIQNKIRYMKENQEQFENISYNHDFHHYTAIYAVAGFVVILVGLVGWRWRRGRAARVPSPSREETAHPPMELVVNHECSSTSDQCQNVVQGFQKSGSGRKSKRDRGTSPFVKKAVFKVGEQLV